MGILFKALTPDAWVVIAILGVMSLISWVVMIAKGLSIGRTGAANGDFLYNYEQQVFEGPQPRGVGAIRRRQAAPRL